MRRRDRRKPSPSRNGSTPHAPVRSARPSRLAGVLERPGPDSPFPPPPAAIVRGFSAAASSVPLVITAFVLLFLFWLVLISIGFDGPFGRLTNLLAIPPVSTYTDALNATAIFGFGGSGFLATAGLIIVRGFVWALLAGLAVAALDGSSWQLGALRGLRAFPSAVLASLLGLSLMIVGSIVFPLLGPGLGFLGSVLTLLVTLFLFAYAPIVAANERLNLVDAVRKGMRAALMPGSRHLLLCLVYFFLTLPILVALTPEGSRLGVNPSFATWAYALVATFLHVGFLTTFAHRYLAVADVVPEPVPRQPRPARRASGR